MNYAIESFTGIRPTADLTVANYIGAVKPIIDQERLGTPASVFLAELHATTTASPHDVLRNSRELGRTLIASGVRGEIYSQRQISDLVFETENVLLGLTTVTRLLRLPTLKEKVMKSDDTASATVSLAMYPMLMAADIILARPQTVPTGKDQKPHLEITNELIRGFNRTYEAELPEPDMLEVELPNIMSLDASGRKMSKSYKKGAIFLDETPEAGRKKIMKAVSASTPGPEMDAVLDNMMAIASGLGADDDQLVGLSELAVQARDGQRVMGTFKETVGDVVSTFLKTIHERRASVSDAEVEQRINQGSAWFRPIATETLDHVREAYWR